MQAKRIVLNTEFRSQNSEFWSQELQNETAAFRFVGGD